MQDALNFLCQKCDDLEKIIVLLGEDSQGGDAMSFEKRLERAISNGDADKIEAIFEEIYLEYGKLIAYVISRYVAGKEDIEELTNDVFVNFSKVLFRIELTNIKYYLVHKPKTARSTL